MKKFLIFIITIFLTIFTCACNEEQEPKILFHYLPFSKETVYSSTNIFKPTDKIYYLITLPEKIKSRRMLIQIVKLGKEERLGYELVWGKQVKLRDEQVHYYTDYIVLNEKGAYVMKVYTKDYPVKLIASNEFYIK